MVIAFFVRFLISYTVLFLEYRNLTASQRNQAALFEIHKRLKDIFSGLCDLRT